MPKWLRTLMNEVLAYRLYRDAGFPITNATVARI